MEHFSPPDLPYDKQGFALDKEVSDMFAPPGKPVPQDAMPAEQAHRLIQENAAQLKRFIYTMWDLGIRTQIAYRLATNGVDDAPEMVDDAAEDLLPVNRSGGWYWDATCVVNSAASLALFAEWARLLPATVLPQRFIPGDDLVNAALTLFHRKADEDLR